MEMATIPATDDAYDPVLQWSHQMVTKAEVLGPVLVVLDDAWSELDLEELIFRVPRCKMLVVLWSCLMLLKNIYCAFIPLSLKSDFLFSLSYAILSRICCMIRRSCLRMVAGGKLR